MSHHFSSDTLPIVIFCLAPAIVLMLGARKIAQYNKAIREAYLRKAEAEAEKQKFLGRASVDFWKGYLEAGQTEAPIIFFIGLGMMIFGVFALFHHPHGWK